MSSTENPEELPRAGIIMLGVGDSKTKEGFDLPMPLMFSGFCPVPPEPKGRPKFTTRGGFVRAYTPRNTLAYETMVRKWMIQAYGLRRTPMDGQVLASYEFVLSRPKAVSKKKIFSDKKPDIDNLVKAFLDACDFKAKAPTSAAGVMANDSRISVSIATKRYAKAGEDVGTKFAFMLIDDEEAIEKEISLLSERVRGYASSL